MIDPNELREMANEIDRNIELEQEKLKQEKKAREFEKKRREREKAMAKSNEDESALIISTLTQLQCYQTEYSLVARLALVKPSLRNIGLLGLNQSNLLNTQIHTKTTSICQQD